VFKTIRDEVNNSIYLLSKYNVQLGIVYKYPRQVDCGIMKTGRSFYMAHTFLKRVYDKKWFPFDELNGSAATNWAKTMKYSWIVEESNIILRLIQECTMFFSWWWFYRNRYSEYQLVTVTSTRSAHAQDVQSHSYLWIRVYDRSLMSPIDVRTIWYQNGLSVSSLEIMKYRTTILNFDPKFDSWSNCNPRNNILSTKSHSKNDIDPDYLSVAIHYV